MSRQLQRLIVFYMSLVVLLAAIGAHNQQLHRQHSMLLMDKEALQNQLSDLRVNAAQITGPLAIRNWARAQGMVATPEGGQTVLVAPLSAPNIDVSDNAPVLELQTLWR